MMLTKLKALGGAVIAIVLFILTVGIYRAGGKSERLKQAESNEKAQAAVNDAAVKSNEEFEEKTHEASNTRARAGRFTE